MTKGSPHWGLSIIFGQLSLKKPQLRKTSCNNLYFYYYAKKRNSEYNNLDAKICYPTKKILSNYQKYLEGYYPHSRQFQYWISSKKQDVQLGLHTSSTSIWCCLLQMLPKLIANLVVLPIVGWKNVSLALWNLCLAFGTKNSFL